MVDYEYLYKHVSYDKDTGIFIRLKKFGKYKVGDVVGRLRNDGYLSIKVKGKHYLAHRLAWMYEHKSEPEFIDHINHNRADNRLINLRNTDRIGNQKNRTKQMNNTSGVNGVLWHKQHRKWYANIGVDGKNIFLGLFVEFHEAVNARKNAEVLYGFHINHGKDL